MIFHLCTTEAWEDAVKSGSYTGDTLASQGFIHCSTAAQVVEVADTIYKGKRDLILLVIDEHKVIPNITYEDAGNGKRYPHIYGALTTDAVVKVVDFPSKQDGTFAFPDFEK